MTDRRTGSCLCGCIRLSATLTTREFQACHCIQCQRWTGGGPHYAIRVQDLDVTGEDNLIAYHASAHGERAACRTCGSIVWWKMQNQPVDTIALGMLDDQSDLICTKEIFVDYRPAWMAPIPGARQSTEANEMQKLHDDPNGDAK